MTPTEFLRSRNIVAKNKSDLMIGFDNGTEESLIELLETYHKSELNLLTIPVVGQSEQLLCCCDNPKAFKEMEQGKERCSKCEKPY